MPRSPVLHLVKRLDRRPEAVSVPGVHSRNFAGAADMHQWLRLRREAGLFDSSATDRGRERAWGPDEFQREFLQKSWWQPDRMWLAETTEAWANHADGTDDAPERLGGGGRRVVGTVTLGMRGPAGRRKPIVHWLLVSPTWRRRGIGRLLLSMLERKCWEMGGRQLQVETLRDWSEAVAFYRATGFRERGDAD